MTTKERSGEADRRYSDDMITLNRVFVERIIKALKGTGNEIIIAQLKDKVETLKKQTQLKSGKLKREFTGAEDDHEVLTNIRKISRRYILKNK